MRQKSPYFYDMDQDKLSAQLQKDYKYPLLNFSFVVEDVLSGIPIFSKSIAEKKISEIMHEIQDLKKIRQDILERLDTYVIAHFPSDLLEYLKNSPPGIRKIFLIEKFGLGSFLENTGRRLKLLEKVINEFRPIFKRGSKKPEFLPYIQPIGNAYQIYFLWASVMYKNERVQWQDIQNVHTWLLEALKKSTYVSKIDFPPKKGEKNVGGNIKVLKNEYRNFKVTYELHPLLLPLIYFPRRTTQPFIPKAGFKDFESPSGHHPVISIKFYKDKIKTIFDEDGKLKARETIFEKKQCRSIIRDYRQEEEKSEKDKLLLEVP